MVKVARVAGTIVGNIIIQGLLRNANGLAAAMSLVGLHGMSARSHTSSGNLWHSQGKYLIHRIYRVLHHLEYLGWVNYNLGFPQS